MSDEPTATTRPPKLSEPQGRLLDRLQRSLYGETQVSGTKLRTAKSLKSKGLVTIQKKREKLKLPTQHFAKLTDKGRGVLEDLADVDAKRPNSETS